MAVRDHVIASLRGTDASVYRLWHRSSYGQTHEPTVVARFGVLDGTRSRAAKSTHDRCRHLERGLLGR